VKSNQQSWSKYLWQLATLLLLSGAAQLSLAQVCPIPGSDGPNASLSGVVNEYFPGTAATSAGATTISVGAARNGSGIAAGDLLLVIQMQDASIDSSQTDSYGDGIAGGAASGSTSVGQSGLYEYVVATSAVGAGGGSVVVFGEGAGNGLINGYADAAASASQGQRRFQVVRVPQYSSVTIVSDVTSSPWNGRTGGVVVFDVAGDLAFAGGNINVIGEGFRGGGGRRIEVGTAYLLDTDVRTHIDELSNGTKGEGIAGTPRLISDCFFGFCNPTIDTLVGGYPANGVPGGNPGAPGYDLGRGAPGNAGGGGTDGAASTDNGGNSGGGGGSNFGAGGKGGAAWCASFTSPPCADSGGWGGGTYSASLTANRLFMGGGGGAGSNNNGTGGGTDGRGSSGAPGGGMVLVRVGRFQGSGAILANGANGPSSPSIDGSGGAGAGGSVLAYASAAGGTLVIQARGGNGGSNSAAEPHGPGGGGGGGFVAFAGVVPSINVSGGVSGLTAGGSTNYLATAGSSGSSVTVTGSQIPGVDAPGDCLPQLSATKTTSTPTITAATGATATYSITINNTGGAAQNVSVIDNALPPGWTLSGTPTYVYSPAPPPAAGLLPSGADNVSGGATFPLRAAAAAPGTVPAIGANSLSWGTFFIPKNGNVVITFNVNIADTSAVGTYHNPVGVTFLDPTRTSAGRLVTPILNNAANRAATAYSANTTFQSSGATVGGANYSGLEAGPNTDDVQLLPDLSVTLTHIGSFTPGAAGLGYSLTARNNGRAIRALTFATDQTTSVLIANVPAILAANPLTANNALPAGVTLSGVPTGTNWNCAGAVAGNSNFSCTLPNAFAFPIASGTDFPVLTVPVAVAAAACPGPGNSTATVSIANGETLTANNTAVDGTAINCGQRIDVVKSLNTNSTQVGASSFDVPYRIELKDTGSVDAPNVQAVENLATTFGSGSPALSWSVAPSVAATAPATLAQCALNPAFIAAPTATNILDGRQTLLSGGSCVVTFTVRVTYPSTAAIPLVAQNNSVVATAYANPAATAGGTGSAPVASDTSTNSATPPVVANGDTPSVTPVSLAGIDLLLTKTLAGALTVGQNAVYTLAASNTGGAPTIGTVSVNDTLPTGLQFVSGTGAGWSCTAVGQVVTCSAATTIAGNSAAAPITLTVAVLPTAVPTGTTANVTNTAIVAGGGEPGGATGNNTASTTNLASIPGAAAGSVWRDANNNRVRDAGEPALLNWIVEIINPLTGALIRSSTTDANGQYSLSGLPPGNYRVRFRDPGNNIIYGTPVNGEQSNPQGGSAVAADRSGLDVTIVAGQILAQQSLPLDPSGIVYDSDTRQPLVGATVAFCGPAGFAPSTQLVGGSSYTVNAQCATMITTVNGFYQFLLATGAPAGTYTVAVTPPAAYTPSTIAAQTGTLTPPNGAGFFAVQPQAGPPTGSQATTHYLSLSLATGRQDVVNNHIPLDPRVRAQIVVEKHASVTEAEIGDLVAYTIDVRSIQGGGLPNLNFIDRLPAGFRYVAGTARVRFSGASGLALQADPAGGVGPVLSFNVTSPGGLVLAAGGTMTLSYRVRVGVGAAQGDGTNHIVASSGRTSSNEAVARVRVQGGVFTTEACVVGKVYLDCNNNRLQDPGEPGVPGVRMYFEDGTYLISDSEGKYSYCGLRPTTHVLKVDTTTLPPGALLGIVDNRNALDPESRFVDLRNGELHRADFSLQSCSTDVVDEVKSRQQQGDLYVPPTTNKNIPAAGKTAAPLGARP
jgi:uncharacterized repeat protein (TIGR01451 family)